MDNLKFGNFIKELRKEKKMTQKELAEKIGLTDKAISKWERGLSFPDITLLNSLAETFEVSVSEILNGERGKKEEINLEEAIEEAVEKATARKEKKEKRINKIKKITSIIASILLVLNIILQLGYLFIIKPKGYEYVNDILFYMVNEIILISIMLVTGLLIKLKRNKIKNILIYSIFTILTILNIAFLINTGLDNKSIVSFSKNFSNELVLKVNQQTGQITYYKNVKFIIFASPFQIFSHESSGKIKYDWITTDICSITFKDKEENLRQFVATYEDRKNITSYNNITGALLGEWKNISQFGKDTSLISDSKGITIEKNEIKETFEYEDCEQYGTTAIVLYKNKVPRYVIGLNEDCVIDEEKVIIKKGGTITLCEVSMDKVSCEKLECVSYKDENLENYKIVNLKANEYIIKNGILYISYDGKNVIEVPGNYYNVDKFQENNYIISEEKTVFIYRKNQNQEMIYSNNQGNTWETVEIPKEYSIQSIQFINKDVGYMLEFEDVAMSEAFGKILKTTDGGKSWQNLYYGLGAKGEERFKRGSNIRFINETLGFLTMPSAGGENSEIYVTRNGGISFEKLEIQQPDEEKEIYDYYNLPEKENGILTLTIGQGSDGDYNGGDSKIYISNDDAITWKIKGE